MALTDNIILFAQAVGADIRRLMTQINGRASDLSALTTTAKDNLVAAINEVNAKPAGGAINDTTASTTTTYSSSKINAELATKANSSHTHAIGTITGLQDALDARLLASAVSPFALTLLDDADAPTFRSTLGLGTAATWSAVPNNHVTNARLAASPANTLKGNNTASSGGPSDLTVAQVKALLAYAIADVSGLQTALDGKANTSHTHSIANVTNLQTELNNRVRYDADQTLNLTQQNRAANNIGVGPVDTDFVASYVAARDAP